MAVHQNGTTPRFVVRLADEHRYVIDVHWPGGAVEQLIGVFVSKEHAERWLRGCKSALPKKPLRRDARRLPARA